ncbi:GNAT family N-acetyltransferase [Eisenbergiella sp.]
MEITVKKYMPIDYDFVYQLKKECYYPYVTEIWGWDEEKQTDYFNAFMEKAKENMNIIYARDKRIGMINCSIDGDTYELENICILPEYRNQGIGSRLLAETIERCGYSKVRLQAFKKNPVIHLYYRLGFTIVEETENHYRMLLEK